MLLHLHDFYYDIHSKLGEDGILYCIFKLIGVYTETFLSISKTEHKSLQTHFGFASIVDPPVAHTMEYVRNTPFKTDTLDLLVLDAGGVEYWLLRSVLERISPNVICCRFNHVIPADRSVTVPYVPESKRNELFDVNYFGLSLGALRTVLNAEEYVFVGVSRFAVYAFFVKRALLPRNVTFSEPNLNEIPAIRYAREHRWPKVSNKFWIVVKHKLAHSR